MSTHTAKCEIAPHQRTSQAGPLSCCGSAQKDPKYLDSLDHEVVWKDSMGRMRYGAAVGNGMESINKISEIDTSNYGFAAAEPPAKDTSQRLPIRGPPSFRAGGYQPDNAAIAAEDPDGMAAGERWSNAKMMRQLRDSLIINALVFIANESITAYIMTYWRPMEWSIMWILLTISVSSIALFSVRYRHSLGLIVFLVLQIMFCAINLQHLNMSHSEVVRSCATAQIDFRGCDVPALENCIFKGKCTLDEIHKVHPPCHALGQIECDAFVKNEWVLWLNQIINFLSYSEPCWWASLFLIRLEITNQSEGGNWTSFRRLMGGKDLPAEQAQQGYNRLGATMLIGGALFVLIWSGVNGVLSMKEAI